MSGNCGEMQNLGGYSFPEKDYRVASVGAHVYAWPVQGLLFILFSLLLSEELNTFCEQDAVLADGRWRCDSGKSDPSVVAAHWERARKE